MRYRLTPNSWSKASAKVLSALSIVGSSLAISQNFILPGGIQFQALETYDLKQVSVATHIEYSKDQGNDEVRLSEPDHPSGLGVFQISTGQKKTSGQKGILEFYIAPGNNDIELKDISLSANGKYNVTYPPVSAADKESGQCSNEKDCPKDNPQLNIEDNYWISSNALKSVLISPDRAVKKAIIADISPEDFDSLHPTINIADSSCTMGAPDFNSRCQELQAVIVRYVPEDYTGFYQLTIHLLTPSTVAASETKLKIASLLTSELIKPVWLTVLGTVFPYRPNQITNSKTYPVYTKIPDKGVARETMMDMFTDIANRERQVWIQGTNSGSVYSDDKALYEEQNEVFSLFSTNNALQIDMHPGSRKFEAETVAMTLDILGGDNLLITDPDTGDIVSKGTGFVTGGGTISNLSAMMTYEKLARANGIARPAMIASRGVHTSINKAAYTFNFDLIEVEPDPKTLAMNVAEIKRQIEQNPNIVAVIASTPDYSLGVIDPIEELSDMVVEFNNLGRTIWFHVDACLGGFILPFAYEFIDELNDESCRELKAMKKKAGQVFEPQQCHRMSLPKPPYHYPGVTSVSADLHKFGKTIKGLSVITFRNHALAKAQYFSQPDWVGGATITHGPKGSYSEAMLAAGYHALLRTGRDGYVRSARSILKTAHRFQNIVRMHPELEIIGKPSMVFAFKASNPEKLNIMHIADVMKSFTPKWRFNPIQYPSGLRFCVTGPQLFDIKTGDRKPIVTLESDPLIPDDIYEDFTDPTKLFSMDLMAVIPVAEQMKQNGIPAQTGSMYGMGAAGIPVEDVTVADAILQAGKQIMLETAENGLEPLYKMGRQIIKTHIHDKLQLPAY